MLLIETIIGGILAAGVLYLYKSRSNRAMKSFFAGTLTLAALIYVGFALFGIVAGTATASWLLIELVGFGIYFTFAYCGFRKWAMLLAIGWSLHVVWDLAIHYSASVSFVPPFYPGICLGFDLVFAAYIFYRFYLRYKE